MLKFPEVVRGSSRASASGAARPTEVENTEIHMWALDATVDEIAVPSTGCRKLSPTESGGIIRTD
jgi:hypothetical protein